MTPGYCQRRVRPSLPNAVQHADSYLPLPSLLILIVTQRCESATHTEIAHVEWNCKSRTVTIVQFDGEKFVAALDSTRRARNMTWRKVADEAHVSASTLTRLSQGKRPDVDSLGALTHWAGLDTNAFYKSDVPATTTEPLAKVTAYLRADPNLSDDGAKALEAILHATYEQFRKK